MSVTKIIRLIFGSISFFFYYLGEIILANIQVAREILAPEYNLRPAILKIPMHISSDAQLLVLHNLITMTPGTLSIDVAPDRKAIYVHVMMVDDIEKAKQEIKNSIEKRILEMS